MAEPAANGEHSLDLAGTRNVLLSNSTKRRTSELHSLRDRLIGDDGSYDLQGLPVIGVTALMDN